MNNTQNVNAGCLHPLVQPESPQTTMQYHKCSNPACETQMSEGSPEYCPTCQLRQQLAWPAGVFRVQDEPGEHDPCYLICPDGLMIEFNAHAINGTDQRRAQWIADTLNARLNNANEQQICSPSPSSEQKPT